MIHLHHCWSCTRDWTCKDVRCTREPEMTCPLCDAELDAGVETKSVPVVLGWGE